MPDEAKGFMRLAQSEVEVNVVGDDKVGTFETREAAAYCLIHEQDVKRLMLNTAALQLLRKKEGGKYQALVSEALKDAQKRVP